MYLIKGTFLARAPTPNIAIGCCLTALDVLLVLSLFDGRPDSPTSTGGPRSSTRGRFRLLEAAVALLILIIFVCFAVEVALSKPSFPGVLRGFFLPDLPALVTDGPKLYIAMGILGATVHPLPSPLFADGFPLNPPNRRHSTHFHR